MITLMRFIFSRKCVYIYFYLIFSIKKPNDWQEIFAPLLIFSILTVRNFRPLSLWSSEHTLFHIPIFFHP